tara:strand:+ start:1284 stop:1928 length:645 start_codon:yes stop_codon:yes gene_type:complete
MTKSMGCRVRADSWQPEWLVAGARVDLIVLTLDGRHLNTVVFHQTPSYLAFEAAAVRHFSSAISSLDESRPVILALSGGGTRAAVVAHTTLRVLERRRIAPCAIAACSGGAWGLVLYAQVGDRLGFAHLVRNGTMVEALSYGQRIGMAITYDVLGSHIETVLHTLRALIRMDFDWKRLVQTMLFGDRAPMTWSALFARLPTRTSFVAMSSGIVE